MRIIVVKPSKLHLNHSSTEEWETDFFMLTYYNDDHTIVSLLLCPYSLFNKEKGNSTFLILYSTQTGKRETNN